MSWKHKFICNRPVLGVHRSLFCSEPMALLSVMTDGPSASSFPWQAEPTMAPGTPGPVPTPPLGHEQGRDLLVPTALGEGDRVAFP